LRRAPGDDEGGAVSGLLAKIPEGAWDSALADQSWQGEVLVEAHSMVLEIKLFTEAGRGQLRFATFADVTLRSSRVVELQRRHDELESTYQRLAGTQQQLLQSEKMASIGQLAAGVAHEINNPVGYIQSNLATLQDYVSALFELQTAYVDALESDDPSAS